MQKWKLPIILIIILKLVMLGLFSSGFQDQLFIPFVDFYIKNLTNPWDYFLQNNLPDSFPYPPLMLYVLSVFYFPVQYLGGDLIFLKNLFFKFPTLLADLLILVVLIKLFPNKIKEVMIFYFLSPIVFYSAYVYSQLDLLPTALLMCSVYFLVKNKLFVSSVIFGLALSMKFHVIAALPLIILFLFKNKKKISYHIFLPILIYLLFALPFLLSKGYLELVVGNKEQSQIFNVFFDFDSLKIYLAPLSVFLVYIRFVGYKKVNNALFFSTMTLLFSIFLLLVPPMPAWYIWIVPFMSIFFINNFLENTKTAIMLYATLSLAYLIYFICFHESLYDEIILLGSSLGQMNFSEQSTNIVFTVLEASLFTVCYFVYKYGVKSNSVYRKKTEAFTIGLGGDSGAGKTTLLKDIKSIFTQERVLEIEGDGSHKWERGHESWDDFTHLNPKANYLHRQTENLLELKKGNSIDLIEYDHSTGKFTPPKKVNPNDYVIFCGLHPFYLPKMRKNIDLKIYIDTEEKLRRHWKVVRDMAKRGYSKEKVLQQIEYRMEDANKFIYPQKNFADLIIQYYSTDSYSLGDPNFNPSLSLKLTLDSNINLDFLVYSLEKQRVTVMHNYSNDLRTQYISIESNNINVSFNFSGLLDHLVENKEEIIEGDISWETGYRGLIQLVILVMVSEKMKEE